MILETPRLILRPFADEDLDRMAELMADKNFMRFSMGPLTRDALAEYQNDELNAAYLTVTGHVVSGLMVLGVAEFLKLVLIERLFCLSRDKLMSIPAFALCYEKAQKVRCWITSLGAWRLARRAALIVKRTLRRHVLAYQSEEREQVSWQSR